MSTSTRLGSKIRALRRSQHLSQAQLSSRLGISASYLNLIEHNQRPLTAPLLLKMATLFRIDLSAFSGDDEARLLADLHEAFADPLFEEHDVTNVDLRELASNPPAARAVVSLYRAYRGSLEARQALAALVSDGGDLPGIDAARLPSEEVSDLIEKNRNHFPELEDAAERIAREASPDPADVYPGLVRHLSGSHGVRVLIAPGGDGRGPIRRFDAERRELHLSEILPPRARNFQLAHQIGLLTLGPLFEKIGSRGRLTTADSMSLARVALANYFAGALLMPYGPFLDSARALRYDIELLGHRFRTSFEQVCHRLTTLQRPGHEGVPFHFIRVDIAGNISKHFSNSGIRFARFSGLCPKWNVHSAFMTPESIRTQLSRMPDGATYLCVARTVRKDHGGHRSAHTLFAISLGCEVSHARELVYSDGLDLGNSGAAVPIGITCRLCERMDCEQRAFPPIPQRLSIDENSRGSSFSTRPAADRNV